MKHDKKDEITLKDVVPLIETIANNLASFQQEMSEFKQEMMEFKVDMVNFKLDMTEFKDEARNAIRDLRTDVKEIKEGQFTPTEKEDLLGLVRHINKRLENEAEGEKDITLTRDEYDAASLAKGFRNRFQAPEEAFE